MLAAIDARFARSCTWRREVRGAHGGAVATRAVTRTERTILVHLLQAQPQYGAAASGAQRMEIGATVNRLQAGGDIVITPGDQIVDRGPRNDAAAGAEVVYTVASADLEVGGQCWRLTLARPTAHAPVV
jgi:hypothetical protein